MGNATPQRRHGVGLALALALACTAWLEPGPVRAQTSDVYRWIEMLPAAKSRKDEKADGRSDSKSDPKPDKNEKPARPAVNPGTTAARRPEPAKLAAPSAPAGRSSAPGLSPAAAGAAPPAPPSSAVATRGLTPGAPADPPAATSAAGQPSNSLDPAAAPNGPRTVPASPGAASAPDSSLPESPDQRPAAEPPAAAAPEPPPIQLKVAYREPLAVTPEAMRSGVKEGQVRARLTVEPDGHVSRVEILSSTPRGVFDRSVIRALQQWRYEPIRERQSAEIELAFKLDE